MLKFNLGSIPVEVRPSHLLIAGVLSLQWMQIFSAGGERLAPAVLMGILIVFVSILVHELGHAVVSRLFGYQPSIVIEWFGGHTSPNANGPIPWHKDVLLTLAGPFAGGMLGVAALAVVLFSGRPLGIDPAQPLWFAGLQLLAVANLFWALLNLLPVLPLDGGRISHALATRVLGRRGVLVSQGLALIICVGVIAWGVKSNQLFIIIFFGLWGFGAFKALNAYLRGESSGAEAHPADLAFVQAATLFRENKLSETRQIAERALEMTPPPGPASRARLHHLLGWVSLKEGKGEEALQHFAHTNSRDLEPSALGAAYALVGDDERAVTLFERAYLMRKDPTILAEWAATHIRLGREEEARKVAGAEMKEAWRAAERVYYLRGRFDDAAAVGRRALEEYPSAELAYDTACSLARAGRVPEAQAMLDRAAELGFSDSTHAASDPDLAAVRQTRAFDGWLRRVQESASR